MSRNLRGINQTHQVPFCDFVLCNMFDGDGFSVPQPDPVINCAKASLSQNSSDAIQLLEAAFLQWFTGVFKTAAISAIVTVWPLGSHCFHVDLWYIIVLIRRGVKCFHWKCNSFAMFLFYIAVKFSAIFLSRHTGRLVTARAWGGDHLWPLTAEVGKQLMSVCWSLCPRELSDRSRARSGARVAGAGTGRWRLSGRLETRERGERERLRVARVGRWDASPWAAGAVTNYRGILRVNNNWRDIYHFLLQVWLLFNTW